MRQVVKFRVSYLASPRKPKTLNVLLLRMFDNIPMPWTRKKELDAMLSMSS